MIALAAVMAAALLFPLKAMAVETCEVDVEDDGDDADDLCAAWEHANDNNGCSLMNVVRSAMEDEECAIDAEDNYAAVIILRAPDACEQATGQASCAGDNGPAVGGGETSRITVDAPIEISGKPKSNGSKDYDDGGGDPLIISGYNMKYLPACLGNACNPGHDGDWENHFLEDRMDSNHDAFGDPTNTETTQVVISIPNETERSSLRVDVGDDKAAFELMNLAYLQLRHINIELLHGAAIDFEQARCVSVNNVRIDVGAENEADAVIRWSPSYSTADACESIFRTQSAAMGGANRLRLHIDRSGEMEFSVIRLGGSHTAGDLSQMAMQAAISNVAFDTDVLPSGMSIVGWYGAEEVVCDVRGYDQDPGTWRCLFSDAQILSVHRLMENGKWEDETPRYTIKEAEQVSDGEIVLHSLSETIFTHAGRRIATRMPRCPDESQATPALACTIVNGEFTGFADDGTPTFTCDPGYKKVESDCVLDCREHTQLSEDGTQCLLDPGYEWNIDRSAIGAECPGDAVPDALVTGACVCAGGEEAFYDRDAAGWQCLRTCPTPERHGTGERDEEGRCLCVDGYELKGSRCKEIKTGNAGASPAVRTAARTPSPGEEESIGETAEDSADTACPGIFCSGGVNAAEGGDEDASVTTRSPAGSGGGCSLSAGTEPGWGGALLLLAALGLLRRIRHKGKI